MNDLTHASFFSGVGGLDLGLERAGWRTVSFSEIDPYASAVLAERWPGVPNLGDITALADGGRRGQPTVAAHLERWRDSGAGCAALWSGGFPCQDLSVAGKRAGFAGARSSLAFAFLDLVERHRPPAILLENVPGLLSSHAGRDFGTLLDTLGQLRYGWAYRILDARHFGVPQRRRRVFILALDTERGPGAERAAEVLSVGSRCDRHPPAGVQAGPGVAPRAQPGVDIARAVTGTSGKRHDDDTDTLVSAPPDPGGVRAADGLAGRLDDRAVVNALDQRRGGADDNEAQAGHLVATLRAQRPADGGSGDTVVVTIGDPSALLPLGLDSHRYRCCGNGVVSSVAEWIGYRLAEALA